MTGRVEFDGDEVGRVAERGCTGALICWGHVDGGSGI